MLQLYLNFVALHAGLLECAINRRFVTSRLYCGVVVHFKIVQFIGHKVRTQILSFLCLFAQLYWDLFLNRHFTRLLFCSSGFEMTLQYYYHLFIVAWWILRYIQSTQSILHFLPFSFVYFGRLPGTAQ